MADNLQDFFEENTQWTDTHVDPAASQPPQPPRSRKEMRRRRNRRKRKTMVTLVAVLVVIALICIAGFFGYRQFKSWYSNRTQSTVIQDYPGPGGEEIQFTVETGQGAAEIAKNLVAQDIVKSESAFTSAVAANNVTLYPGTYDLKKQMAAADVVAILSDQSKASGFLEVRSGERVSDVITNAASISGIAQTEFQSIIDKGGTGILPDEAGGKFEGWFEPGTYDVKSKSSASDILNEMVQARITKLDSMGAPTGSERERLLIIASIAESEVNSEEYYGKVVRVILNRLNANMNLGMDTTVAYGLGISASQLTDAMLADASNPYNTRVNAGLPPTPISNPGDNAISAAMNPPEGDWLYFVTTNLQTGETKFATTEEEFWKIRDEYKSSNENAN